VVFPQPFCDFEACIVGSVLDQNVMHIGAGRIVDRKVQHFVCNDTYIRTYWYIIYNLLEVVVRLMQCVVACDRWNYLR